MQVTFGGRAGNVFLKKASFGGATLRTPRFAELLPAVEWQEVKKKRENHAR